MSLVYILNGTLISLWLLVVMYTLYKCYKSVREEQAYYDMRKKELDHSFDIYIESLRDGHFKKP